MDITSQARQIPGKGSDEVWVAVGERRVHDVCMWGLLVLQTITFRVAVVVIDYLILLLIMREGTGAGMVTIFRHALLTFLYWFHELIWASRRLGKVARRLKKTRWEALIKTVSFRAISLVVDAVLMISITRSWQIGGLAAILVGISNTIFYYYHDLWWKRWRLKHVVGKQKKRITY